VKDGKISHPREENLQGPEAVGQTTPKHLPHQSQSLQNEHPRQIAERKDGGTGEEKVFQKRGSTGKTKQGLSLPRKRSKAAARRK